MKMFFLCSLFALALSACSAGVGPVDVVTVDSDLLGFTERAQIRAQAAVDVAEQDRLAREAEAQAVVDAEGKRQNGQSLRVATFATVAPILLLIPVAGVLIGMVIRYGYLVIMWKLENQPYSYLPPMPPALPDVWRAALAARDCDAEYEHGQWYIVPAGSKKRLPIPEHMLLEVR